MVIRYLPFQTVLIWKYRGQIDSYSHFTLTFVHQHSIYCRAFTGIQSSLSEETLAIDRGILGDNICWKNWTFLTRELPMKTCSSFVKVYARIDRHKFWSKSSNFAYRVLQNYWFFVQLWDCSFLNYFKWTAANWL